MSAAAPDDRTYTRDEVEAILRTAAQVDDPQRTPSHSASIADEGERLDNMALAEIQEIGAQVGITRSAVAAATISLALDAAYTGTHQFQHVHTIAGELPDGGLNQLADELRGLATVARITRTDGALEFELDKKSGEPGRLLVSIRSGQGATTISIWSDAPHLSYGEIISCGFVGIPVALFPVVAFAGGQWPSLGVIGALGAAGAGIGTAATLAWQRWATIRWRKRIANLLLPLVTRTHALAESADRALPRASDR